MCLFVVFGTFWVSTLEGYAHHVVVSPFIGMLSDDYYSFRLVLYKVNLCCFGFRYLSPLDLL